MKKHWVYLYLLFSLLTNCQFQLYNPFETSSFQKHSDIDATATIEPQTPMPTEVPTPEPTWAPTPAPNDNFNNSVNGVAVLTEPSIAINDDGDSILAWVDEDSNGNPHLYIAEYSNGSWTAPENENDYISPNVGDVYYPNVAIDNSGNKIVVWMQTNGISSNIYMSEYREGLWNHPNDFLDFINPSVINSNAYPVVCMNNNNRALIVYFGSDGNSLDGIYKSEYFTGTWIHAANEYDYINPSGLSYSQYPSVAMDDNNNALIAWNGYNGTSFEIYKSQYQNQSWIHPSDAADCLSSAITDDSINTTVALSENGDAIIGWKGSSSYFHLFISEYRSGSWTYPSGNSDYIDISAKGIDDYMLAMNAAGETIISYTGILDNDSERIFLSEYSSGSWTHPANSGDYLSPEGGGNGCYTYCDIADDGEALVVWNQNNGTGDYIMYSEKRHGLWDHPENLADHVISPDGMALYPRVFMNIDFASIIWREDTKIFLYELR